MAGKNDKPKLVDKIERDFARALKWFKKIKAKRQDQTGALHGKYYRPV